MQRTETESAAKARRPVTLPPDLAALRLLRPAEVAELLRCSRSHLYRLAKAGELPRPVRLSHGVAGWRLSDVLELIERRSATG